MLDFFHILYAKATRDFMSAIEQDEVDLLSQLIKDKTTANKTYRNGVSLLYKACTKDAFNCLIWLLKIGADPDILNTYPLPWTPLRFAVENNLTSLCRLLIMHGANPDKPKPGENYITPRHMANANMKKLIAETEQFYQSLQHLKIHYDSIKKQADNAFKVPAMEEAGQLYRQAAKQYHAISEIWAQLQDMEDEPVLKNYYQERCGHYLKAATALEQVVQPASSTDVVQTAKIPALPIRQRKVAMQKQQPMQQDVAASPRVYSP